ncbi:MAG: hypothetical protein PHD67_05675 [Oscillospiraceae bacterium]|nr:hypothetical protein [Oscillospiraceae bacterium]
MALPRMRYPEQALEELRKDDPDTAVTLSFIRRLVASGKLPVVTVGNHRRLLNYDALLEYLADPNRGEPEEPRGTIRKVPERAGGGVTYGATAKDRT